MKILLYIFISISRYKDKSDLRMMVDLLFKQFIDLIENPFIQFLLYVNNSFEKSLHKFISRDICVDSCFYHTIESFNMDLKLYDSFKLVFQLAFFKTIILY